MSQFIYSEAKDTDFSDNLEEEEEEKEEEKGNVSFIDDNTVLMIRLPLTIC